MAQNGVSRGRRTVGARLFVLYALFFGGFLALNVFWPEGMAGTVVELPGDRALTLHGVNLAVVYGLGLIIGAFLLAMYYAWMKRGENQS